MTAWKRRDERNIAAPGLFVKNGIGERFLSLGLHLLNIVRVEAQLAKVKFEHMIGSPKQPARPSPAAILLD